MPFLRGKSQVSGEAGNKNNIRPFSRQTGIQVIHFADSHYFVARVDKRGIVAFQITFI